MFRQYYRIKEKGSIYYLKWIVPDDHRGGIMTDIKEDALQFPYFKAKKVVKELLGEFVLERVPKNEG